MAHIDNMKDIEEGKKHLNFIQRHKLSDLMHLLIFIWPKRKMKF